jgi:hypothetical protein
MGDEKQEERQWGEAVLMPVLETANLMSFTIK